MQKKITFRSMAHSDAIEQYVTNKIQKISKFFKRDSSNVDMQVVLDAHREKHYFQVEFKIDSCNYHMFVKSQGSDMYAMIDEVISKISKDIARKKEKRAHGYHHAYGA